VTLVRHPLDVYVSVVRFCAVEPETALWLLGENGDERVIAGCGPNDDAAIAYGQSSRFQSPVKSLIDRYSFERLHVEHPHHHAVGPNASWSDVLTETTIEALVPTLRWHLDRFGYSAKEPFQ
jgi:hypothetical protein